MRLEELKEDMPEVPEKIHSMIQNEVDKQLIGQWTVPTSRRRVRKWTTGSVVAAAMAGVLFFSGVGYAATQYYLWSNKPEVSEYVQRNIFRDESEHLSLSVEEFLSDGACTRAIVKLCALDEEGERWLHEDGPGANPIKSFYKLNISYASKASGSSGTQFLENVSTETEEYYYLECTDTSGTTEEVTLTYFFPSAGKKQKTLEIKDKIPIKEYKLVSQDGEKMSEYYEPQIIRISPMSYNIYGDSEGLFIHEVQDNHYVREIIPPMEEYSEEYVVNVYLVKKNGKEFCIKSAGGLGDIYDPNNPDGYDCQVSYGNFDLSVYLKGGDEAKLQTWNLDDVVAIRLENKKKSVVYTLEEL